MQTQVSQMRASLRGNRQKSFQYPFRHEHLKLRNLSFANRVLAGFGSQSLTSVATRIYELRIENQILHFPFVKTEKLINCIENNIGYGFDTDIQKPGQNVLWCSENISRKRANETSRLTLHRK